MQIMKKMSIKRTKFIILYNEYINVYHYQSENGTSEIYVRKTVARRFVTFFNILRPHSLAQSLPKKNNFCRGHWWVLNFNKVHMTCKARLCDKFGYLGCDPTESCKAERVGSFEAKQNRRRRRQAG